MEGWICLHRKIIEWEWYTDIPVRILFEHLLLTANHEDKFWKGVEIKRGQKLTSIKHLSEETGLSKQQIRTAISKLQTTREITIKSTNKYSVITLVKYSDYQDKTVQSNKQNNKQTRTQITTNNNINNITNNIYSSSDNESNNDNSSLPSKKDNNTIANSDNFDKIWAIYPKKTAKGKSYQFYVKWIKGNTYLDKKIKLTNRQIYSAVNKYKQECEKNNRDKQYILAGSTFFNQRIMDYVELEE